MFKSMFSGASEYLIIKEQANFMVKEMTNGIFHVEKDRFNECPKFISRSRVIEQLNDMERVVIMTKANEYYSNSKLKNFYEI